MPVTRSAFARNSCWIERTMVVLRCDSRDSGPAPMTGTSQTRTSLAEGITRKEGDQEKGGNDESRNQEEGILIHQSSLRSLRLSLIAAKFIQPRMLGTQRPTKMAAWRKPRNQTTMDSPRERMAAALNRNSERERFMLPCGSMFASGGDASTDR